MTFPNSQDVFTFSNIHKINALGLLAFVRTINIYLDSKGLFTIFDHMLNTALLDLEIKF